MGLGYALQFPNKDLASAVRLLRASEACAVRRICGGAAPDHHGHLARVIVELLFLHIVLQDPLREVTQIYPSLKLRVFVDHITALLMGKIWKWLKQQRR